ncbi:MAG TPA: serine hydrolase domain-containing protein, partial [Pirellulales bacterium]
AGLFSTARDLAIYADAMSHAGRRDEVVILDEPTWREMIRPREWNGQKRGLGWDEQSGFSSNRGQNFGPRSFGHGGFTGTSFWIDPDRDLFVVFLSNRLHPDGKGAVNSLAGAIGTLAAEAVDAARPAPPRLPGDSLD